ncbi:MAG: vanadium-dependent haloperoxidase, partial [Planctomycetaceae bacterium]
SPPPQVQGGAWQPTPPGFLPPLEPAAGSWRPWHLRRGDVYRPPPPPRPGEDGYAAQVSQVYAVARSLTPEQAATARFWADGPGTVTPPGHWNKIAFDLLRQHRLGLREATQILATLNTAQADAFIACWDAKYAYYSERPVTAIRRDLDPEFLPLLATPPFPSYVSGHSTTSAAAATVLGAFFPTARARLNAWASEAAASRLYAGIHFDFDNRAGLGLGRKVGRAALAAPPPWDEDRDEHVDRDVRPHSPRIAD